jgi:hypothetical protein
MKYRLGRLPYLPELYARLPHAGPHLDKLITANEGMPAPDWGREVAEWAMLANGPPGIPAAPSGVGDCTAVAACNASNLWGSYNPPVTYAIDADALGLYHQVCPTFDPATGAGDNGALITDVLSLWLTEGFQCGGQVSRLSAYPTVDPKNHAHVQAAIWAFGCVDIGLDIYTGDEACFDNGVALDQITGPLEGSHCILGVGADTGGVKAITWAGTMSLTWEGWDARVVECYGLLSPRWLAAGKAPQGLDLDAMLAEANALKN